MGAPFSQRTYTHTHKKVLYELNFMPPNGGNRLRVFNRFLWCLPGSHVAPLTRHDLRKTEAEWVEWSCTVAADAIATTSFAVGWERQLIAIARDFKAEIVRRMPSTDKRAVLRRFLDCVEAKAKQMYEAESQYWIAVSIGMARGGMDRDLCRLILPPGRIRHRGVPLDAMPRFLRLPPPDYSWGLHRHRRR